MNKIVGIKKGMTRIFDGNKSIAVTVIDTNGAVVTQVNKNGVELGVGKNLSKPNKALQGKYKELGFVPMYRVWVSGEFDLKPGDKVEAEKLEKGAKIDVTSVSKGKGFAGVVKRWGFAGGPKTHGQSDRLRAPGSIGAGTTPGRVLKGKKMAGRMGGDRITVKNKRIVEISDGYLLVSGAVPGPKDGVVTITLV